jgi:hypothetical protein
LDRFLTKNINTLIWLSQAIHCTLHRAYIPFSSRRNASSTRNNHSFSDLRQSHFFGKKHLTLLCFISV